MRCCPTELRNFWFNVDYSVSQPITQIVFDENGSKASEEHEIYENGSKGNDEEEILGMEIKFDNSDELNKQDQNEGNSSFLTNRQAKG